ncbi:hypothetical protein CJF32_00006101 [Rutstroemia sp. NJR-2017a WRK4]|nr:hypothetical protein CJF32_00006101 [Rutstroemia sp. NJR-2017a WRK4]
MDTPENIPHRTFGSLGNRSFPYTPTRTVTASSKWSDSFRSTSTTSSSTDSTTFWLTPPKAWKPRMRFKISGSHDLRRHMTLRALAISVALFIAFVLVASTLFLLRAGVPSADVMEVHNLGSYTPILPELPAPKTKVPDPVAWLKENSDNKYAVSDGVWSSMSLNKRPKAALISLVRNSELEGIRQSMMQLEMRWNHKYQYPWIFFNDEPFSEEFKEGTRNLTAAKCYYEVVPKEHWSLPEWIDEARFMNSLEYLGTIGVGKGWMVSYHHMCRWNSGFFYRHPALADYEWYWRVEPDVHYFCDINYDIFRFMRDNNLKYGFNMNILDDARSFPSLWSRTLSFMRAHPQLLHPSANLTWLLDSETHSYNNCQYFSNFEIGSLAFWRGAGPSAYFDWLDRAGGFYYERFGDAPVHTLSVGLFAERRDVWYFADVGYMHGINRFCPRGREGACACEATRVDEGFYKLVPRKPEDTCLRGWLGGEWTRKREGWSREGEVALGGDGYGGYEVWGDE